jgi:hypothetical protein
MYAQVENPKENKSRVFANNVGQKKNNGKQGFVDNRTHVERALQTNMELQKVVKRKRTREAGAEIQLQPVETPSPKVHPRLLCLVDDLKLDIENECVQKNSELLNEGKRLLEEVFDVLKSGGPATEYQLADGRSENALAIQTEEMTQKYKDQNKSVQPKQLVSRIAASISTAAVGALLFGILAYRSKVKAEKKRLAELKENKDWLKKLKERYPDGNAVRKDIHNLKGAEGNEDGTSCSMNAQIVGAARQGLTPQQCLDTKLEQGKKKEDDSQEKIVKRIATLLGGYEMLYVQITPDHHFTLLPLPDGKAAILQGWQDRYTLSECLKSEEMIKPIAEIIDSLNGLRKKCTLSSASVNLFGVTDKAKDEIREDCGKEDSYCRISNVMVVPKQK